MPVYEYACTSCGERTEARQSFDDPPLETCARCGGKLRKLYSPVGVVFKGSGFYSTDAKGSSSKGSDKPEDKPSDKKTADTSPKKKEDKAPAASSGEPS